MRFVAWFQVVAGVNPPLSPCLAATEEHANLFDEEHAGEGSLTRRSMSG